MVICLYEQNVYCIEMNKVQVRTFQVTIISFFFVAVVILKPIWKKNTMCKIYGNFAILIVYLFQQLWYQF